ncbi:MAG TPA: ATP-binding cassette domain-containing protein [Oscillospiraceae bacterium]|nr:ATP-binding cassette domain-containing protein [Oscillospiraceae bacterium]
MSISVQNLVKRFGDYTAVDNLSFEVLKPGVFALLGTNGAGKTTAIRMILGMLSKEGGTAQWEGKPIGDQTANIGYLAEERGLYPKVLVMDQLMYFAELKGMSRDAAAKSIKHWLERLNVGDNAQKRAEQLSKGNQQKIQLVTALLADPKLLILDEPLSGLDPVNSDLFRSVIKEEVAKGKHIIMSSHQMATVEEFCDDLVILDKGKTIVKGNLNEIKKGYGRVKLSVKSDDDIMPLVQSMGLEVVNKTPAETQLKVTNETQAKDFLAKMLENGMSIVKFELREPSLHEIFVETVGGARDEF